MTHRATTTRLAHCTEDSLHVRGRRLAELHTTPEAARTSTDFKLTRACQNLLPKFHGIMLPTPAEHPRHLPAPLSKNGHHCNPGPPKHLAIGLK